MRFHSVTITATALSLTALTTTTGAMAAQARPHSPDCVTSIRVLQRAGEPGAGTEAVEDIGTGTLSVGTSAQLPVYWTGRTVHKVPIPTGYSAGEVTAVNRHGLMVGTLRGASGHAAFAYQRGAARVTLLPRGTYASDVNDAGRVVGGAATTTSEGFVWKNGRIERQLKVDSGFTIDRVSGINNAGAVTAEAYYYDNERGGSVGLVWPRKTTKTPLPLTRVADVNTEDIWGVNGIDDYGRIVGAATVGHSDVGNETYWDAPYREKKQIDQLPGYDRDSFNAISPTIRLVAGTAAISQSDPETPPDQATVWPGSGPVRALPALFSGGAAGALAAGDNNVVGGWAADKADTRRPVIWTCAIP